MARHLSASSFMTVVACGCGGTRNLSLSQTLCDGGALRPLGRHALTTMRAEILRGERLSTERALVLMVR